MNSLALNAAGNIFAAAAGGAFLSTDNGEIWSDISSGLIPAGGNVWSHGHRCRWQSRSPGTAGGGVFRSVQSTAANACPQTRRYWKDNPALWPVMSLMLGSQSYGKAELQKIIDGDGRNGDASLVLARHLIAAKLNLANGSDPGPVSSTIAEADALLSEFLRQVALCSRAIVAAGPGDGHRCGCPASITMSAT